MVFRQIFKDFIHIAANAQAQMIDAALGSLRQTGARRQDAEVYQISAASELINADVLDDPFQAEPKHVYIEGETALYVRDLKYRVIDSVKFQRTRCNGTSYCASTVLDCYCSR